MDYIPREINALAKEEAGQYPIVTFTGPRQSGKSTFLKHAFPDYRYVSFENENERRLAQEDPVGFFSQYDDRTIIDEAQKVPHIFSYLQSMVDNKPGTGQFILSGSQNFLLMKSITQSLAGRVALCTLLPFSYHEIHEKLSKQNPLEEWLFQGGFPRIYDYGLQVVRFYKYYISTYLERDVRAELGASSLADFERFLQLCALRNGQLLNITKLANEAEINVKTARAWLSILEQSFVLFFVPSYGKNTGVRVKKAPKLYFCDTGLVAYLLGLQSAEDMYLSEYRGSLFETAVYLEILKTCNAHGWFPRISYLRDSNNKEVDFILEIGAKIKACLEVKSKKTNEIGDFSNMNKLSHVLNATPSQNFLIYAGDKTVETKFGSFVAFKDLHIFLASLFAE